MQQFLRGQFAYLHELLHHDILTSLPMNTQPELTHIERMTRNAIIVQLRKVGFTVGSIAKIVNVSPSIVSRVADKEGDTRIKDIVFKLGE